MLGIRLEGFPGPPEMPVTISNYGLELLEHGQLLRRIQGKLAIPSTLGALLDGQPRATRRDGRFQLVSGNAHIGESKDVRHATFHDRCVRPDTDHLKPAQAPGPSCQEHETSTFVLCTDLSQLLVDINTVAGPALVDLGGKRAPDSLHVLHEFRSGPNQALLADPVSEDAERSQAVLDGRCRLALIEPFVHKRPHVLLAEAVDGIEPIPQQFQLFEAEVKDVRPCLLRTIRRAAVSSDSPQVLRLLEQIGKLLLPVSLHRERTVSPFCPGFLPGPFPLNMSPMR